MAKDSNCGAAAISENVQAAVEGLKLQVPFAQRRQPIDAISEIDGLVGEKNSLLRN